MNRHRHHHDYTSINPPIHLTQLKRMDDLDDLGTDMIHWAAHFDVNGKPVWQLVFFEHLWRWAETAQPDVAAYFDRIRGGIPGWGPKHTRIFAVLDEEGFDIEPLIVRFIRANYKLEDILKSHERAAAEAAAAPPARHQQLEARLADLTETATGAGNAQRQWDAFAEALLAFATAKAVEVYPEIINSGPEHIKALGHTLYDKLREVADAVAEVAYKARQDGGK